MDNEDTFVGELGLIILGLFLLSIFIPILLGIGVGLLMGATGLMYYGVVITIAAFIWLMFGIMMMV